MGIRLSNMIYTRYSHCDPETLSWYGETLDIKGAELYKKERTEIIEIDHFIRDKWIPRLLSGFFKGKKVKRFIAENTRYKSRKEAEDSIKSRSDLDKERSDLSKGIYYLNSMLVLTLVSGKEVVIKRPLKELEEAMNKVMAERKELATLRALINI